MSIQKKEPLVSVILPCYNSQNTISKTLASLENQNLRDFEVVLVNDGSTDQTDSIIRKYIETSKLVFKYIVQENSGVSSARNVGLRIAAGRYVAFIDSDDIYHKDILKKLVGLIENRSLDTAFCSYTRDMDCIESKEYRESDDVITILDHNGLMNSFMHRKGPCGFFTFIYSREIINKHGIDFPADIKYGEDLEFTWRYLSYCSSGAFLDRELYGYFDNPDSVMNSVKWRMVDSIDSISRVGAHLKNKNDDFYQPFSDYMYARAVWAVLKNFSLARNKNLYNQLIEEYDVRNSMKALVKAPNALILIRISALIFLIHPNLFYTIVRKD